MKALRPGDGSVCSAVVSSTVPVDAFDVSMSGDSPVTVTFSRGAKRVAVPAKRLDASRWQVAGTQLSAPGTWRIEVAAQRKGQPRAAFATAWTVSTLPLPPGTHRPRYSQRGLEPILTALALLLAALLGSAGLWLNRDRLRIRRPRTA